MGHGREFWQNVVHWRKEQQATSVFLPWESHEHYEKAKRYDTEKWTPQYATRDEWRNNSKKKGELEPNPKQCPAVDVIGDGSKVWCYKEYCTGTWNIMFINQGKLEFVKQEMARVNMDFLGISELKCPGMGAFNSMASISTFVSKNSLEEMG